MEEELDDAKRDYIPKLEFGLQRANKMGRDAEKENEQLKQQLNDLPKNIVGEIEEQLFNYFKVKTPAYLDSVRLQIKDVDYYKNYEKYVISNIDF